MKRQVINSEDQPAGAGKRRVSKNVLIPGILVTMSYWTLGDKELPAAVFG